MIKLILEIWPGGDESRKEVIAKGFIANDGTGNLEVGNYAFSLHDKTGKRSGKLKKFPRRQGPLELLRRCLQKTVVEQ